MIERYTLPEMVEIWKDNAKIFNWVKVERAAIIAMNKLGLIDSEIAEQIIEHTSTWYYKTDQFVEKVTEKEKETKHDVAAFVDMLAEDVEFKVPGAGRWIHYGLTSSDVLDTAFSMQLVQAIDMINDKVADLEDVLLDMAHKYKHTVIMGRTHGMNAEPTTFGLIILNYYMEFLRHMSRLHEATNIIRVGKLSGAVGTFSHLSPEFEQIALAQLELKPAPTSNQILQRDRHAQVFNTLALLASSIEKLALQIRHMQRTEIGEVQESFSEGQKGSSAMPHKKNPILSENLCGLARLIRGYAQSAMENIALWHERDISHSSVERIIAPDAFCLVDFMLDRITKIMSNLIVNEDRMIENVCENEERWASQAFLLKLIDAGFDRKDAYVMVQNAAMSSYGSGYGFSFHMRREMQRAEMEFEEIDEIINSATSMDNHLRNIDKIFERAFK